MLSPFRVAGKALIFLSVVMPLKAQAQLTSAKPEDGERYLASVILPDAITDCFQNIKTGEIRAETDSGEINSPLDPAPVKLHITTRGMPEKISGVTFVQGERGQEIRRIFIDSGKAIDGPITKDTSEEMAYSTGARGLIKACLRAFVHT